MNMHTHKNPDPIDIAVGARVREMRTARGLSQEFVADRLGVTFQQVQKYEKGTNRIAASHLFRLSRLMQVKVGDFFADIEEDTGTTIPLFSDESASMIKTFAKINEPVMQQAALGALRAIAKYDAGDA